MTTKLVIRWDGSVPGLQEHSLSLAAWAHVLPQLLVAYRRVASGMLTEAQSPEYGGKGGQLHVQAKALDLRLRAIGEGCVVLDLEAASLAEQLDFVLAGRALGRLVEHVAAEAGSTASNGEVRKLLQMMPPGVTTQRWQAWEGDRLLAEASFGAARLPPESVIDMPHLIRVRGPIVAIGFDPPGITVREGSIRQKYSATEDQVEDALTLRAAEVVALGVRTHAGTRLLWVRREGAAVSRRSPEERAESIRTTWAAALEILGR
jgi:hypothetical protein